MKRIFVFICLSLTILILEIITSLLIGFPNRFRVFFYNPMSWQDILNNKYDFVYSTIIVSIPLTILYFLCKKKFGIEDKKNESRVPLNDSILDKIIEDALKGKKATEDSESEVDDTENAEKEGCDVKN